jgi:hypothetical protein
LIWLDKAPAPRRIVEQLFVDIQSFFWLIGQPAASGTILARRGVMKSLPLDRLRATDIAFAPAGTLLPAAGVSALSAARSFSVTAR